MRFDILTIFPGMFMQVLGESVIGRAIASGAVEVGLTDIRGFSADKHKKTDDYPYGGGMGMVMTPQPVYDAWLSVVGARHAADGARHAANGASHAADGAGHAANGAGHADIAPDGVAPDAAPWTIYMSPQGRPLTQKRALELAAMPWLVLLCGHYEGVDERVLELVADEEISIGDYVLTGGELPAMVLVDCVSRLVPGVLPGSEAFSSDSHFDGLLEFPQYTRPQVFMGKAVPDVLLSGHHKNIEAWRHEQSIARTREKRPDIPLPPEPEPAPPARKKKRAKGGGGAGGGGDVDSELFARIGEELRACGVFQHGFVDTADVEFMHEVRKMCEANTCRMYGATWACPPAVGTVDECRDRCRAYGRMLVFSGKYDLEDSFDYEGMEAAGKAFKAVARRVGEALRPRLGDFLLLANEGCDACASCTYPGAPCRSPELAHGSIEGYGILVGELARKAGMDYYNGPDTVTYFAALAFDL